MARLTQPIHGDVFSIHSFLKIAPNMLIYIQASSNNNLEACAKASTVPSQLRIQLTMFPVKAHDSLSRAITHPSRG